MPEEPARDADGPAAPLEAAETRAQVAAVMDGLPDDQRQAMEWKYMDDLSVREIARRLGRTEKAAETVLYRARNAFREAFERRTPEAT
ncbi:MAG TPA: sigma-70 family RNA polymerase sigma factor [Phycisphaerae bacterium]|nr:sigma-70 family RNA polymerase sigma factor [Phycisphaerae bacterium]